MANFAYSSSIQDRVAYALHGRAYSNLSSEQKAAFDGTSSSDPPTAGRAKDAFLTIRKLAQWWEQTDSSTVSDAAEAWFVAEMVFLLSLNQRPERIGEFKATREQAMNDYIDTITTTAITTGYTSDVFATPCLQSLRYYVLRRIANVSRKALTSTPPEEIDAASIWCLNWVWYKAMWNFKTRLITITVPTSGNGASPTLGLAAGETFDGLSTQNIYYSASTPDYVQWANQDVMAAYKADTTASTGKPQWFRIQRSGSTRTWIWHPYPDQEYTLKAEVFIELPGTTTPGVPDTVTETVPWSKLPREFFHPYRELVLGRVMHNRGLGDETWKSAVDEVERFLPIYADHSNADIDGAVRDVYRDSYWMRGGGLGGYGFGYATGVGGPM